MDDSSKSRDQLVAEVNLLRQKYCFELEEKDRELAHLKRLLEIGNATLSLDLVMEKVMDALRDVLNFNQVAIYLFNAEKDTLEPKYWYGHNIGEALQSQLSKFPVSIEWDDVQMVRAFLDVEPIYLSPFNAELAGELSDFDCKMYEWSPCKAKAFIPLQVQEKVIGVMVLSDTRAQFRLSAEHCERIQRYVGQVATSINNAYLVRKTEYALARAKAREREIVHLNNVLQAANSTLDFDQVFRVVVNGLQDIFTFDAVGIQLADESQQHLEIYKVYGERGLADYVMQWQSVPVTTLPGDSVSSYVYHHGEPAYFPEIKEGMPFTETDWAFYSIVPFVSYLAFPLVVQQHSVGVINFFSAVKRPTLSDDELETIQRYVLAVSSAINNASRFQKLLQKEEVFRSITVAQSK